MTAKGDDRPTEDSKNNEATAPSGRTRPNPDDQKSSQARKEQDMTTTEPVWTFRGYRLRSSEFNTAMAHFFRAEVARANVWRQRLDATTNWAVIATGAVLSFAFAQASSNHSVILLNMMLVTLFLYIESRRYRYYELWSSRVRLMETDFFAAMLVPPFHPSPDWAETLANNLLHPCFPISFWEAIGRRLRRNYLWIYGVVVAAWFFQLWLLPYSAGSWEVLVNRAAIGGISGLLVMISVIIFLGLLILLSLLTVGLQEASGEVLSHLDGIAEVTASTGAQGLQKLRERAWYRPSKKRQQYLSLIITEKDKVVSERILKEMNRGVTSLPGTGMFTGENRNVLMCALTTTEVPHLKSLVAKEDPEAFVIIAPVREILGTGFIPFPEEE
jgi:uncharacterized membrane protein